MTTFQQAKSAIAIRRSISHSRNSEYRKAELVKKNAMIHEAIAFPGSSPQGNFTYTEVWSNGEYAVCFGKYGKEYYREGNKRNVNDMAPTIFRKGKVCNYDASFRSIFRLLENVRKDKGVLTILGCLFVRNAFLVDHIESGNSYRYHIPLQALRYLEEHVDNHAGIPIEVFLMYIDAIAWQEDVKYFTKGKLITSDIGRKNNMLTYARFAACLLGKSSYAEMLNKFSMGVSPLPKKEIALVFRELYTSY